jgi:hypothetical protein
VKSVEIVQGEKSTLFLSFPEFASRECVHEAGDGSGVFAVNAFDAGWTSALLRCCFGSAALPGGLGRDSGGQAFKLVGASEACEGNAIRAGQMKESEGSTSRIVMIHSRKNIDNKHYQQGKSKTSKTPYMCAYGEVLRD